MTAKTIADWRAALAAGVTPEAVVREVAAEKGITLGPWVEAFDARIQGIVDNWPQAVEGARAVALGLPVPPTLKGIVEEYVEDYLG